jgi:hypothetical protein
MIEANPVLIRRQSRNRASLFRFDFEKSQKALSGVLVSSVLQNLNSAFVTQKTQPNDVCSIQSRLHMSS